nr:HEAT repeat domain-containing protein [Nodosilinea nodulosa]
MTQALSHQERSNHFAAIRALENLGNERALSVLTTTLSHEDTDVRFEAAKSLAKLGNEEGIHVLINVLNSGENKLYTHQQVDLVRALSQLKSEIVLFALINACENEDKDKEVRQAAMLELANLSNDMAIPRLIAALRDKNEDPYLKFIAAWSLKDLNREKFISELFKAFQGDNHDLLLRVIESSGQMDNEMENKLLEALYGEGPDIRREAAEALGQMNNKAAIDWLLVALQYGHVKAGPALQNIKGDLAAYALSDLLTLIPTSSGQDAFRALTAIQNHCQFYNYEIFKDIIPQGNTISLYVSYAAADEVLQIQLANHLILLERQGVITSWSSHQILPGGDRTQTIHRQINTADIILLLISAHSLADDTCYHLEIQRAMERHQSGMCQQK